MDKDTNLPESDASFDVTGGSLSGATAADLQRGFTNAESNGEEAGELSEVYSADFDDAPVPDGGFLGRPKGWER